MNKAFTKEEDGGTHQRLPDLPISSHPNHVTPNGLVTLQDRQVALFGQIATLRDAGDGPETLHALSVAERDLRYVDARLATAILVTPPVGNYDKVQFGAEVVVEDDNGNRRIFHLVGDDEADPANGLIAAHSPLASALLESKISEIVEWVKPTGTEDLEIIEIRKR